MMLKLGLAQMNPVLGDQKRNLAIYQQAVQQAEAERVHLLVFPELFLTGYFLKDLVPEIAMRLESRDLAVLKEGSKKLGLVVGGVEESSDHRFYNAAFYFEKEKLQHVHRKVYLPTYGMFDEQRYFAAGQTFRTVATQYGRIGFLLCEDAWHFLAPYILVQEGADFLVILSSSPGRGFENGKLKSTQTWTRLLQFYAEFLTTPVVYVNRVGYEDGVAFSGGSQVYDATGTCVFQAPLLEEGFYAVSLEVEKTRTARMTSPLLRDEQVGVMLKELERVWRSSE